MKPWNTLGRARRRNLYFGRSVGVLAFLAIALLLPSCNAGFGGRDPGPQDDIGEAGSPGEEPSAGSEAGVSVLELINDPSAYYDQNVTISGTVARVYEPRVFSITSDEPPDDEEPVEDQAVLVVGGDGSNVDLAEEQVVQVTGPVQRFEPQEIENSLGIDLGDEVYEAYGESEKPAIIAESVEPQPGETTQQEKTGG